MRILWKKYRVFCTVLSIYSGLATVIINIIDYVLLYFLPRNFDTSVSLIGL